MGRLSRFIILFYYFVFCVVSCFAVMVEKEIPLGHPMKPVAGLSRIVRGWLPQHATFSCEL